MELESTGGVSVHFKGSGLSKYWLFTISAPVSTNEITSVSAGSVVNVAGLVGEYEVSRVRSFSSGVRSAKYGGVAKGWSVQLTRKPSCV